MRTLFTITFFLFGFAAFSQSALTGTVIDSTSQKPVEFATVALQDANNKTIDGTVCGADGKFTLNKIGDGRYKLTITFVGYNTKDINVNISDKKDINLGNIIISPTQQILKEITIEGQKALIEEKVDRTIYNAENDATAKGGDATDVLKRVPLLSVDMDGNVSLRGNSNITVLINNKPSTIVATSVADALKQIPADQIKTVEVITSPSAKYDAEGSAGIINIVTKKNNLQGLTLNIDAGIGLRGSNLGLNGNYRKGKMGFSLGGWGRANYNVNGSFRNEQISNSQTVIQSADTRNNGLFGHYNFGWDYDINKKNTLSASVRFGVRNNKSYQDDLTQRFISAIKDSTSMWDSKTLDENNNVDVNMTYTHLYEKPQRELSFQALYSRNNRQNDFQNIYYNLSDMSVNSRLKNLNDSYNQEITLQADYQTPIGDNQMLEFGGKDIMRKAFSDFATFNSKAEGEFVPSLSGSFNNNLNYDQNVMASYLSYTYSFKSGYSIKGGSRYEYTTINAYSQTENDIKIPSYGVIVPSLNVSKKLKNGNMVKASYNRRIQRPSIRFLNPNVQQQNPLNITIGNPSLSPEYTNNFELSYSTFIKGTTLNFSAFTRNTNDAIQSVTETIAKVNTNPDTLVTRYANIGSENAHGLSLFANVNIGKLSLNGGGDVFYAMLDNNSPEAKYRAKNEGMVFSGRVFGNYNLSKGWGLQFFSFYRGRQVQLQGTQGGFYMYSLAIRKEFNEKRGSIGIGAENFLQSSIKIKGETETIAVRRYTVNTMNNLSFRINFSYRIGKMSMDAPRRSKKSINNDDLKDGGGGDMNMGGDGQQQQQRSGGQGNFSGGQRPQSAPAKPVELPQSKDTTVYEAAGTWNYTTDAPQGGGGVIVITKIDGVYGGTIKTERMREPAQLSSVTVSGNNVSFSYKVNFGGNEVVIDVKTVISNNDMQGVMNIGTFRSVNITGKRG